MKKSIKTSKDLLTGCLIALDEILGVCSSCFKVMQESLARQNKGMIVVLLKTMAICFFVKRYPAWKICRWSILQVISIYLAIAANEVHFL